MSKRNNLYTVVVYIGGLESRIRKALYQTTKESDAERYVAQYIKANPNCEKIYIEHTFASKVDKRRLSEMFND